MLESRGAAHRATDRALTGHSPPSLSETVADSSIHYRDPPRHNCVGDTMNCEDLRVLEFRERLPRAAGWARRPELERELPDVDEVWGEMGL